jgi:iron complex transport system substrate-binding protein
VAVRPDFIIEQGETYDAGRISLWEQKCGAPVVLLNAHTLAGVEESIGKIAAWLGVEEKGKTVVSDFREWRAPHWKTHTAGKTAFFEIGRSPLWSAGSDTLIGDVLANLGLQNVAKIRSYKQFSTESLAKADPDFYIVTSAEPDKEKTLRELRAVPALRGLKAIRQGHVIVVPADWVLRPGPRLIEGMREIERQIEKSH